MANTISSSVDHTVDLGTGVYSSSLTVTSSGDIDPTVTTAGSVYDGVTTAVAGSSVTNYGTVDGSLGTTTGTAAANGGVGVDLSTGNDTVTNDSGGYINGGDGAGYVFGQSGSASLASSATYNAGNGGAGVVLDSSGGSLSNSGVIRAGVGGNVGLDGSDATGNGGDGVDLSGGAWLASNTGEIEGGSGGVNDGTGAAGFGGAGIRLGASTVESFNSRNIEGGGGGTGSTGQIGGAGGSGAVLTSASLYSSGFIEGGDGGDGKAAGIGGGGVLLTDGATLVNAGRVYGGAGASNTGGGYSANGYGVKATDSTVTNYSGGLLYGSTGAKIYGGTFSNAGAVDGAGVAATGAYLSDSTSTTNSNTGDILSIGPGGTGLIMSGSYLDNSGRIGGGNGSTPTTFPSGGIAGAGGIGVYLENGSTLTSTGYFYGGYGGEDGIGGAGGAGAKVVGGSTLIDSGHIVGGRSGYSVITPGDTQTTFAAGGVGVDLVSGTLNNSASLIAGGSGGVAGTGGAGIYLGAGGTLNNLSGAGTIEGGTGAGSTTESEGTNSGIVHTLTPAGVGGVGIDMGPGASLTLGFGTVTGGAGGYGANTENSAAGGAGIAVNSATLTVGNGANAVTVTGGSGGSVIIGGNANGGNGGAGIYLTGTGSVTAGAEATFAGGGGGSGAGSGSAGSQGDAVQFAASSSTTGSLTIDPGAYFNGAVYGGHGAGADSDLILSGTSAATLSGGLGTQFTDFDHLTFSQGSSWTVDAVSNAAGGITSLGNIYGFVAGDTIDLTDLTLNAVHSATFLAGKLTVINGDTTLTFNIDEAPGTVFAMTAASASGGIDITTTATVACYLRGTHIMTEAGDVAIEELRMGDRVLTADGSYKPIRWIGRRSYSAWAAASDRAVWPVLIAANALAEGLPRRDLWVSPDHAMYIDGMLIPARDLVNGESILQEEAVHDVTYYHLEFDTHAAIFAEGAAAESFVDDESREMFDNAAEFHLLYPNEIRRPARLCAPRVEEGWELEVVRRRLAERAVTMKSQLPWGGGKVVSRAAEVCRAI